jgi:HEAT repeat protein
VRLSRTVFVCFALVFVSVAQAQTVKEVRSVAKQGPNALPKLGEYLKNSDTQIRLEAVKGIVDVGTAKSLDYLIEATHDVDEGIQIRATDGIVNFYVPGYVPIGVTAKIQRAGTSIKSRFTDHNDQVIDPFIIVRPDAIQAIGVLIRGGSSQDSRANSARAVGVLRGKQALPDLYEGVRSKDSEVLYESVVAIEKIGDPSAGPKIQYLIRDLKEKVQLAAIETTGILNNRAALPELRTILATTNKPKVKRVTLIAIAMMPDPQDREIFTTFLKDKDDAMRATAAEGFGRLRNPADVPMLQKAYEEETKRAPQISLAFALVMDGKTEVSMSLDTGPTPLRFLIDQLNQVSYRNQAQALLTEAAHDPAIRAQLYGPMEQGTKDEKIALAQILAQTGDRAAEPYLDKISRDTDKQVAEEGLRALRNLRARM